MASLFKQRDSTFWWVKFRDRTGKICRQSTGFRHTIGADTRKAQELEARKTLEERQTPAGLPGRWDDWVEDFITAAVAGRTRERYLTAWRTLRMFLEEFKIAAPREVTYQNCSGYVTWRCVPDKRKGKYQCGKNTAILEFKILRWIMREAVKRDYCTGNPAREVVLKREPRKLFPDLEDATLQKIYAAILTESKPMQACYLHSFAISLLHGVRLNETNINPMTDVKLAATPPTIRFVQKGGRERIKPLHPQLVPMFQKLQEDKATETYPMERTKNGRMRWGNRWTKFLLRHGFKDDDGATCFHSLRVTVENVLREGGVEQRVRESYLTHEHSADVNARYDRVKLREMLACHAPLNRPWLKVCDHCPATSDSNNSNATTAMDMTQ